MVTKCWPIPVVKVLRPDLDPQAALRVEGAFGKRHKIEDAIRIKVCEDGCPCENAASWDLCVLEPDPRAGCPHASRPYHSPWTARVITLLQDDIVAAVASEVSNQERKRT